MSDNHESDIVHEELDTDVKNPAVEIVRVVADLKNVDTSELSTVWDCIDGMLDHLFSNPPSDEAQIDVTFSYEGFRITVEQNGHAKFVETA